MRVPVSQAEVSVMVSLGESLVKVTEPASIGKISIRQSASTPCIKVMSAELPPVPQPKVAVTNKRAASQSKDNLFLRRQLQLHRFAIDFSSGHRIRLLHRAKPTLRPLLV